MTPKFILPAGYQTRTVEFVLTRDYPRGWSFRGYANGYSVPARDREGNPIPGVANRRSAAALAIALALPAYAVWNGRTRRYDGKGAEFIAQARDAQ